MERCTSAEFGIHMVFQALSLCLSFVFTYYTQNEHCKGNYSENTALPKVSSSFYLHFLRHMFPIRVLVFCGHSILCYVPCFFYIKLKVVSWSLRFLLPPQENKCLTASPSPLPFFPWSVPTLVRTFCCFFPPYKMLKCKMKETCS